MSAKKVIEVVLREPVRSQGGSGPKIVRVSKRSAKPLQVILGFKRTDIVYWEELLDPSIMQITFNECVVGIKCDKPELINAEIHGAVSSDYSHKDQIQYVCKYSGEVLFASCKEGVWIVTANCSGMEHPCL